MLFRNDSTEIVKVRLNKEGIGYKWVSVRPRQTIDLPLNQGLSLGFLKLEETEEKEEVEKEEESTEKKDNEESVVEQEDDKELKLYKNKLKSIKGIGLKTISGIINIYNTEKELITAIQSGDNLPFRDDLKDKLKVAFNG